MTRFFVLGGAEIAGSTEINPRKCDRLKKLEAEQSDSMFVFLSDVWLDHPDVMAKLAKLFAGKQLKPRVFTHDTTCVSGPTWLFLTLHPRDLTRVFSCVGYHAVPPTAFVLMGNFLSTVDPGAQHAKTLKVCRE